MRKLEMVETVIDMVTAYFNLESIDVAYDFGTFDENEYAFCTDFGEGVYEIEINWSWFVKATEEDIVKVVAHEMVHVKQYEQDGLVLENDCFWYKGKEVQEDYWFCPWEIEARGYEQAFWSMYEAS